MTEEIFLDLLAKHNDAFVQVKGTTDWSQGWKLSIQGRTLEDSKYLLQHLMELFQATGVSFKFATQMLIDTKHPQQSHKLLTVYLPRDVDAKSYAELVHNLIKDYKGGEGIIPEGYEHYKNAIFFRNDRDANGHYVIPYKKQEDGREDSQ